MAFARLGVQITDTTFRISVWTADKSMDKGEGRKVERLTKPDLEQHGFRRD